MTKENVIPFPQEKTCSQIYQKSLDHQIEHIMSLPAEDRLKAISENHNPEALVQKMPEQDFYITVKELNTKDALILLKNATPSQLNFLFDMEWWEKFIPDEEKAWEWLEFLRTNTPRQLLSWLKNVDTELLISLLKKWLILDKVPDPDDTDFMEATDKLPPYTIDDVYYWNARKAEKLPLLKTIISTLFELDRKLYFRIMEEIIWGIQAELEEEAYRWRKGRLEDLAVPDFYDALDIYKEIDLDDLYEKNRIDKKDSNVQTPDVTPAIYPLVLLPRKNTLAKAVEQIRDAELLDFLKIEFASLANKVVIADRLSLGEPESLKQAVEKVVGYLQLGLDRAGKKSVHSVVEFLESFPLESIFRLGATLVRRLRKRAQIVISEGWIAHWPHKTLILPSPYQSMLEALLLKDPLCIRVSSGGTLETKPFSSLDDVIWTSKKLSEIEWLEDTYRALDVDYLYISKNLWPLGQPGDCMEIKIDDLIATALINNILEKEISCKPIAKRNLPEAVTRLQKISRKETDKIIAEFTAEFDFSSEESEKSNVAYIKMVLDQFLDNISGIKNSENLDPRFIEGILIEKE